MADFGPLAGAVQSVVLKGTRGTSQKDAGLRAGGPVHRAIGIREKPDGPPRLLVPALTGARPGRNRRLQTGPKSLPDWGPVA